ncbi:MAG TPA: DinB family protein [Pyrinomonadaceae bacterium]|nr:DinB family protein [Pyrinomonadaceae bacterium]
MRNDVDGIISQLEDVTADVRESFSRLTSEQLNWKPAPDSWSVAQCLDHLIKSNEEFYPELDKLAAGTRKNTFWQSWSPLSGIAGAFLVSTLKKDGNKVKTNQKMTPPSDIGADILERFSQHQSQFIEKIRRAADADWHKTILTSPFVKIMTYRMDVGLAALIEHEKRHVRQAKRVVSADGFPHIDQTEQTAEARA